MSTLAEPHRCGKVEYYLAPNAIGPILVEGQEIVRRVFVTVRDASWNEVELQHSILELDQTRDGRVVLGGDHDGADVRFSWTGELYIDPELNELSYSVAGEVLRHGEICRLGLIVLLPPDRVVGSSGAIGCGERKLPVAFEPGLGPQPIVNDLPTGLTEPFDRLELTGADRGTLELTFAGELFEIEDQRNWGDASFKIYCTPLARGFPRAVERGDHIEHKVQVRYQLAASQRGGVEVERLNPRSFPAIGIASTAFHGSARDLPWSYVSGRAEEIATCDVSGGCKLELLVDSSDFRDSHQLLEAIRRYGDKLRQILLAGDDGALPGTDDLVALRAAATPPGVPIFAATRGWFVEFNRNAELPNGRKGFAWPVTPTVHSRDVSTMFENAAPFTPMAAHLRNQGAAHLAISNLSWGGATSNATIPAAPVDVLTWLIAVLIDAAKAGINSLTLGDDLVKHLSSEAGTQREFARLIALSGAPVTPIATNIEGVSALLFSASDGPGTLVVNCGRTAAIVPLPREDRVSETALPVELPPRSFAVVTQTEGLVSHASAEFAA